MIVLIYVNDCKLFAHNKPDIKTMINKIQHNKLEIKPEHDMARFLEVLVEPNDKGNSFTLTKIGLIDRVIIALSLEGGNRKRAPAEIGALPADKEGEQCNEAFNYTRVVGMLSYLSGHTRPKLEFSENQCAQ